MSVAFVLSLVGCGKDGATAPAGVDYGRPETSVYRLVYFRFEEMHDPSYVAERAYPAWQSVEGPLDGGPLQIQVSRDSVRMEMQSSLSAKQKIVQLPGGTDTTQALVCMWILSSCDRWLDIRGTVTRGASFRFLTAHQFSNDPYPVIQDLKQPSGEFAGWPLNGTYTIHGDTLSYTLVRVPWEETPGQAPVPWKQSYTAKYLR